MNIWQHLNPTQIEKIHSISTSLKAKEGTILAHEGDKADCFFIVIEGELSICNHVPKKGTKILETLGPGEMVGWSWLLKSSNWSFDVQVHRKASVLKIPAAKIFQLMEKDFAFKEAILVSVIEVLASRLKNTRILFNDLYQNSSTETHT
jgi:CRP-like cAMP-binding protein